MPATGANCDAACGVGEPDLGGNPASEGARDSSRLGASGWASRASRYANVCATTGWTWCEAGEEGVRRRVREEGVTAVSILCAARTLFPAQSMWTSLYRRCDPVPHARAERSLACAQTNGSNFTTHRSIRNRRFPRLHAPQSPLKLRKQRLKLVLRRIGQFREPGEQGQEAWPSQRFGKVVRHPAQRVIHVEKGKHLCAEMGATHVRGSERNDAAQGRRASKLKQHPLFLVRTAPCPPSYAPKRWHAQS